MTLLQQIQTEAVDTHGDLSALLRKCRILAQRLGVPEFKEWVVYELEGYPAEAALPEYRVISTPLVLGHFNGHFGRRIENGQVPITSIPERLRDALTTVPFREGVASVAEMLREHKGGIRVPWPVEAVKLIGQGNIYAGHFLMQALQIVNESAVRGLLDHVQNRILSFVLELEARNPQAGEAVMTTPRIPEEQVRNVFNTIIKGDVQNVAQASERFSQHAGIKVESGDLASLVAALNSIGVQSSEVADLTAAIESDAVNAGGMGDQVKAWLGNVALKAAKGGLSVAGSAAITEAVKQFFGG